MNCIYKLIFSMLVSQQPGLLVCATQMNFSAKKMAPAFPRIGSVMGMRTASLDLMSIMAVLLIPALHLIFSAKMDIVSIKTGFVMGTMTAGTWVMRRTVLLNPFNVPPGSGAVSTPTSVSIWVPYAMASLIAPMGLMSPHFAVSFSTSVYWPWIHSETLSIEYHSCCSIAFEKGLQFFYDFKFM